MTFTRTPYTTRRTHNPTQHRADLDVQKAKGPYRPVEIDGVIYTYSERTQQKYSQHDAVNIAASVANDRGWVLNPCVLSASYSRLADLTTVELNRVVSYMLHA